jgi:hypothetical protein
MNPCGILIFAHPNGFKEVHGFRGSRVQGFIWFRVQRFRVNQMNP